MSVRVGFFAIPVLISMALVSGCGDKKGSGPNSPLVVTRTATYIGTIDSIPLVQLGNLMTSHKFVMCLFSDSSYTLDDTVTIFQYNQTAANPVETGTFSKPGADYVFAPLNCAGNTGVMSPANCTTSSRDGVVQGQTITIAAFLSDSALVLTRQ
jgi:hypothetical protein